MKFQSDQNIIFYIKKPGRRLRCFYKQSMSSALHKVESGRRTETAIRVFYYV